MSRVFNLECKNCGKLFKANSSNVKYCDNCYEDRKCSNKECNNIVPHIFVKDVNNHFCSKECRYKTTTKNKTKPGYCTKCGNWSEKRDSTGRCRSCVSKQVENIDLSDRTYINICQICGKEFNAKTANTKYCRNCYEERKCKNCGKIINRKIPKNYKENIFCNTYCQLQWKSKQNTKPGYCTKCGNWSEKRDSTGRCGDCVSKQVENSWNGCTIENKINRLKGIKLVPNFLYESPNCLKHKECNLQYFDKSSNKYICWECYKEKFGYKLIDIDFSKEIQKEYPNSFMQLTFRDQNSIDWSGSKRAFEQDLIDKKITWFVYIKFYIDINDNNNYDDNLKPIVVGKTGSLLVNLSGTDVDFGEWNGININDTNYTPARIMLYEEDLTWYKDQILVIPCKSENEAFKIENRLQEKYRLFFS